MVILYHIISYIIFYLLKNKTDSKYSVQCMSETQGSKGALTVV